MGDEPKKRIWLKPRAGWAYILISVTAVVLALLLPSIALYFALDQGFQTFTELGLLQPLIAALLAAAIVTSVRVSTGRYVNQRRKNVTSASSATIAVRLWAICFVLLAAAMLLFAVIAQAPHLLQKLPDAPPKTVETQVEVSSNQAAPAVATVKVTR